MSLRSIARNYARALSDTLDGDNALRRVEAELQELGRAIAEVPELSAFLLNPVIPVDRKRAAADEVLAASGASDELRRFIGLILERQRASLILDAVAELSEIAREKLGLADAEVTSAVPLDDEMKSRTIDSLGRLTGRQVRATFRVDPSVLGGVCARVGDTIYDGSLRSRIDRMRESFAD